MKAGKVVKAKAKTTSKKVTFFLESPHAERVLLAGDFNQWNPESNPMKKDSKGIWKAALNLPPGVYQYRFLVDGTWQNDPNSTECVENPFGTLNCVKRVD